MNLSYEPLFAVFFKHDYFNNEKTAAFGVMPDAGTADYMRKAGLLCRSHPDGFAVLFDRNHAGNVRSKETVLKTGKNLRFHLLCKDALLFNYTDLPQEYRPGESCFYFTNRQEHKDGRLHRKETISKEDLCQGQTFPLTTERNCLFGLIKLVLQDVTRDDYFICLAARSTYWRYVLVSDYAKELERPAILDKESTVAFTGPSPLTLPDKKEAIAFVSQSKLPLRQQFGQSFRLVETHDTANGKCKTIVPRLPYPDIRHLSVIDVRSGGENPSHYSNIIL